MSFDISAVSFRVVCHHKTCFLYSLRMAVNSTQTYLPSLSYSAENNSEYLCPSIPRKTPEIHSNYIGFTYIPTVEPICVAREEE